MNKIGLQIVPSPDHSGYLSRDEILTGLTIDSVSTVILSACHTGQVIESETDELVGLPSAFLVAGASAIVGSLWAVHELSTALIMSEFYRRNFTEEHGTASALLGAQIWLREATAVELDLANHYKRIFQASAKQDKKLFKGCAISKPTQMKSRSQSHITGPLFYSGVS